MAVAAERATNEMKSMAKRDQNNDVSDADVHKVQTK